MTEAKRKKIVGAALNVVYPLAALLIVFAVWAIAAAALKKPLILPLPGETLEKFFLLFSGKRFWTSVGWTLLRTLECLSIAFVLAFVAAAIGGLLKPVAKIASPVVGILRAAPTMAVILIAMLWLDGQRAPVLIGFLIAFPLLYQAIYTAITGVDKELVEMARVYKVRPVDKVFKLYAPEIAPAVFDVSRSTLSLTLKVVIAAEVLSYAKNSIGLEMQRANLTFDIGELLAWTILAIVLSFVLEGVVLGLKKLWEVTR